MGFPWQTQDPFLFCVHHEDFYPKGNEKLGPAVSLAGRNLGQDFDPGQPWRMYHGENVPGFPAHPHCGFETVTIATKGLIDHSDSLGAAGRFGNGDVQWMTAGKGVQHCEMFPLVSETTDNTLELFQIWLNLPKAKKMVDAHFTMLWNNTIPTHQHLDSVGKKTLVNIIAGKIDSESAPHPTPNSWAADAANEVAIWTIAMEPDALFELPVASPGVNRSLYFYEGESITVANESFNQHLALELVPQASTIIKNGKTASKLLLLQGKPIGEPVVQYGPFVSNSQQGIQQAMSDFQRTQFGGWPWPSYEHVHGRERGRFAKYPNGKEEIPA